MSESPIQKYPRTPYCPFSPSLSKDALVSPMTTFIGTPVVITEKLDGSNVMLHQGAAYPRSVTSDSRQPWLGMVRKHHAWKTTDYPDIQFYGEDLYGVHAIQYDAMLEEQTFRLFAVRQENTWAGWNEVQKWANLIDVMTVPLITEITFDSMQQAQLMITDLMKKPSAIGPEKEGIVIRKACAFEEQQFQESLCKAVRKHHVQPDADHWSRNWRPCNLLPKQT